MKVGIDMRIIAGDKRGIKLETLPGESVRPTLERVKEAVFSSIQFQLPGATILDLFAGSGQMGLEALSRGASRCVLVDTNPQSIDLIRVNAKHCQLFPQCTVVCMDALSFLKTTKDTFDIIFLDPPYHKDTIQELLPLLEHVVADNGIVLCESEHATLLPQQIGDLLLKKQYKYGIVSISRYQKNTLDD